MDTLSKEEIVEMVIRQTDMSHDEVVDLLEANNYDYMKVIKLSMGIQEKKSDEKIVSLNQQIYKEIRNVMDQASAHYRLLQEQKNNEQA